jgi:putative phosphoesterase
MRILILSDIHSNWPALEAIREPYDICLCLGDLVDYGTHPKECIEWVRRHATYTIRGNHDHGVAQKVPAIGGTGFRFLTSVTRTHNIERIDEIDRQFLRDLPTTITLTLNEKRFYLVHATPRDPLDEYAPADPEFWTRRLEGIEADYVCVGHTHLPYTLQIGKTTILNPGSVGLSRDGDPRISYAILSEEGIQLKRIDYDIEKTIRMLNESPFPDQAKTLLTEVYRTGKINGKDKINWKSDEDQKMKG